MLNIFDVTDKTVLITGSTRGLGYSLAEGFLKAGAEVVASSKTPKNVESAVKKLSAISDNLYGVTMDVTDGVSIKEAVAYIKKKSGRLDVLINNAGIQDRAPFFDMTKEQFDNVMGVNLTSVFAVSQEATKVMRETGGSIVNMSSLNSFGVRPTIANYCSSKGGVNLLTQSMAFELADYNIRVNAIAPGYFITEMTERLANDRDFDEWVKSEVPLKRWGNPEELVGAAIFLSSEASSYITGQVMLIDGGWRSSL